jgi:hypothetical protein
LITLTLHRDANVVGEHYRVFDGDRYVGRIYRGDKARWFWALACDLTAPADPPYGWQEPTRKAAMAKLKAAYAAFVNRP